MCNVNNVCVFWIVPGRKTNVQDSWKVCISVERNYTLCSCVHDVPHILDCDVFSKGIFLHRFSF